MCTSVAVDVGPRATAKNNYRRLRRLSCNINRWIRGVIAEKLEREMQRETANS